MLHTDLRKVLERKRLKSYALRTFPNLLNTVLNSEFISYKKMLFSFTLNLDVYMY